MSAALQLAPRPTIVISQPMLFPWVGLLEQARLADVFIHYDDVQFSKGSFVNRVQLKTASGSRWLTIPIANRRLDSRIDELEIDESQNWRAKHLALLEESYAGAPFVNDAITVLRRVYSLPTHRLVDIVLASFHATLDYFDIARTTHFCMSADLGVPGASSQRVLDHVRKFDGGRYVTGHGARAYLDHEAFDRDGVAVEYMKYQLTPYPQLHGSFTPFVSSLDLIANCGREGRRFISSGTVAWRDFR